MKRTSRNESGFALASAILALVVVGALVTAGFFAASQEARVGTSNAQADLAFYIAEQGLQNTLGTVNRGMVSGVASGEALERTGTVSVGGREVGNYVVEIRPFGNNLYWMESVGEVTEGGRYAGARRRVGTVARSMNVNFPVNGALTTFGGIRVRGTADIIGHDRHPDGWSTDCDTLATSEAGVYTRPEATVSTQGAGTIAGSPAIERDPDLMPSDFEELGDYDFDEFASIATTVWSSGSANPSPVYNGDGSCNTSNWQNWGEPFGPRSDACYNYFPILFHRGDLTITGNGRGQGILFVDGDFNISGRFEFYGIVIIAGSLNKNGGGTAELHGAVMTMNDANIDDESTWGGTPTLQYSRCAVDRSIENNSALGRLFPVDRRSWVDLTGAGVQEI